MRPWTRRFRSRARVSGAGEMSQGSSFIIHSSKAPPSDSWCAPLKRHLLYSFAAPPNGVIRGGPQQRREDGAQPAAASTGSAPGRHGASRFANGSSSAGPTVAAGSPDGTPSATSPIGATPAVRQGPYDTRMSPGGRGAAAAAAAAAAEEDDEEDNAGYGRARGHGQGRPPALQVPTSPPAQPKASPLRRIAASCARPNASWLRCFVSGAGKARNSR